MSSISTENMNKKHFSLCESVYPSVNRFSKLKQKTKWNEITSDNQIEKMDNKFSFLFRLFTIPDFALNSKMVKNR